MLLLHDLLEVVSGGWRVDGGCEYWRRRGGIEGERVGGSRLFVRLADGEELLQLWADVDEVMSELHGAR